MSHIIPFCHSVTKNPDHKITTLEFCTFNFLLPTKYLGHSSDSYQGKKGQCFSYIFRFRTCVFYPMMIIRLTETCSNKLNVQKFRFCDFMVRIFSRESHNF